MSEDALSDLWPLSHSGADAHRERRRVVVDLAEDAHGAVVDARGHHATTGHVERNPTTGRDHVVTEPRITRGAVRPVKRVATIMVVARVGEIRTARSIRRARAAVVGPGIRIGRSLTRAHADDSSDEHQDGGQPHSYPAEHVAPITCGEEQPEPGDSDQIKA